MGCANSQDIRIGLHNHQVFILSVWMETVERGINMDVSSVVPARVSTGSGESGPSSVRVPAVITESTSQINNASVSKAAPSSQAPSSAQVAQAVNQINDAFAQRNQNLFAAIEKDKATGIDVVKIVDKDSKETISQYPSKAIIEIAQALQNPQGLSGQLIRDKA